MIKDHNKYRVIRFPLIYSVNRLLPFLIFARVTHYLYISDNQHKQKIRLPILPLQGGGGHHLYYKPIL